MGNKLKTIPFKNEKMGIYALSYDEHNVRKITKKGFEKLKKSVIDGIYEPIKVWKKDTPAQLETLFPGFYPIRCEAGGGKKATKNQNDSKQHVFEQFHRQTSFG